MPLEREFLVGYPTDQEHISSPVTETNYTHGLHGQLKESNDAKSDGS